MARLALLTFASIFVFLLTAARAEGPLTSDQVGRFVQSIYQIREVTKIYGASWVGTSTLQGTDSGSAQGAVATGWPSKWYDQAGPQPTGPQPTSRATAGSSGTEQSMAAGQVSPMGAMGQATNKMERAQVPFSSALGSMQGHQAYNEILGVIRGNGFADADQWALIGDRVMKAYIGLRMEAQQPEYNAQIQQAMQQIQNSDMSAEQKQMMMQMMQGSSQAMANFQNVPDADKQAVKPHLAAIEGWERLQ